MLFTFVLALEFLSIYFTITSAVLVESYVSLPLKHRRRTLLEYNLQDWQVRGKFNITADSSLNSNIITGESSRLAPREVLYSASISRDAPDACEENLCQNGAGCEQAHCVCLPHYTGRYCENVVNYCTRSPSPCPHNVQCIPRLGGYTCQCPLTYMGIHCDIHKRKSIRDLKQGNFLFHTQQYVGVDSLYYFYASSLGDLFKLDVDMGDGTILVSLNRSRFDRLDNAKEMLMGLFLPPLNIPSQPLMVQMFLYAYKAEGVYNITVRASNRMYPVFHSEYTVRVQRADRCLLTTRLIHCGQNHVIPRNYNRWNHILILSSTRINCTQSTLKFSWSIYKVLDYDYDDPVTEVDPLDLSEEINTKGPHLYIPPFTLPLGDYITVHRVEMFSPAPGLAAEARTSLRILKAPLVARLGGGNVVSAHWDRVLVLDASESYDPNIHPSKQLPLEVRWFCKCWKAPPHLYGVRPRKGDSCTDPYCQGGKRDIGDKGIHLVVPARTLRSRTEYIFKVELNSGAEDTSNRAVLKQKVVMVSSGTPLLRIRCIHNCHHSNPHEVIALEAFCLSCSSIKHLADFAWIIHENGLPFNLNPKFMEYDLKSDEFIVYDGAFKSGNEYDFIINGTNRLTMPDEESTGHAKLTLLFNKPPEGGSCYADPNVGYAMITKFSVYCSNFTDEHTPLMYEVLHYRSPDEMDGRGTIVAYDPGPAVEDFTLAPGVEKFNFMTILRIYVIDSVGLHSFVDCNVEVRPPHYYIQDPEEVLYRLEHVGSGEQSIVGMMFAAGNARDLVQLVSATAVTFRDFLETDSARYVSSSRVHKAAHAIQDFLADYLAHVPIYTVYMLKHTCTAFDLLLKSYHFCSSPESSASVHAAHMVSRVTRTIKDLHRQNISISKRNMQDIGYCMLSLISSLFGHPSNEIWKSNRTESPFLKMNIEHVAKEHFFHNFTGQIMRDVSEFAHYFIKAHMVKHERTFIMEVPKVMLMLKKAVPSHLKKGHFLIEGQATIELFFPAEWYEEHRALYTHVLVVKTNPFWWHTASHFINFPLVNLGVTYASGVKIEVPMKVELQPPKEKRVQLVRGTLKINPYWAFKEYDIQVHRIKVPRGGKLLIQFKPLKDNHKLEVVVKNNFLPELQDFWAGAVTIPRTEKNNSNHTIYIDVPDEPNGTLFYIGILPHKDTFHNVFNISSPMRAFEWYMKKENKRVLEEENENAAVSFHRDKYPKNLSLPYEMAAYSARCLTWNDQEVAWSPDCEVRPSTTPEKVVCRCKDTKPLAVSFRSVPIHLRSYSRVNFFISFLDNPLIIFLLAFISVIFLGLHIWAGMKDREDLWHRDIIFLEDNDPTQMYCYLVMVETGRHVRAGTTSRVAIKLEGSESSSGVHLLATPRRPTLTRGAQDWFVLKTPLSLGELTWIHMWHDHSGTQPDWYCSRVVIHDIHTHHVWFFEVERWLSPLHGDGTMSCSVYRKLENQVSGGRFHFHKNLEKQFDNGQHGWFSIFHRHPYNTFTRRQRVSVAMCHIAMLLLCTVFMSERVRHDLAVDQLSKRGGDYVWSTQEPISGVYTAIIVFPLHLLLATLFRCVTPLPDWTRTRYCFFYSRSARSKRKQKRRSKWYGNTTIEEPNAMDRLALLLGWFRHPRHEFGLPDHDLRVVQSERSSNPVMPRVVPLRRTVTEPDFEKRNIAPSFPTEGKSNLRRRLLLDWYCLPSWFLYILWLLVVFIVMVCVYLTALHSVAYSWALSLRYIVVFFSAFVFSVLVLETAKLLLCTLVSMCTASPLGKIEDRSELVKYLDTDLTLDEDEISFKKLEVLDRREAPAYHPLPQEKVELLKRIATAESSIKRFFSDLGVFVLFAVILACIISGIRDSLAYRATRTIQNLVEGRNAYGLTAFSSIDHQDALISYIKQTLIPSINADQEYYGHIVQDKGVTKDPAYYLLGVPRLRQVRERPEDCIILPHKGWDCHEGHYQWISGDVRNYNPKWKSITRDKRWLKNVNRAAQVWRYQNSWRLGTPIVRGDVSSYPGGGYVALLGRSKQDSRTSLKYLVHEGWFDRLTRTINIELPLFCPDRSLLAVIVLLVERAVTGAYSVHSRVDLLKVQPLTSSGGLFTLVMLIVFIILLILYICREVDKVVTVRPHRYFSSFWHLLGLGLVLLGVIISIMFVYREVVLTNSLEKIRRPDLNDFLNFNFPTQWDSILQILCAVMLFLVLLKMWHVLIVKFRFQLMTVALRQAARPLFIFMVYFVLLLFAFCLLGYLLFVTTSYKFRSLDVAGVSVLGFAQGNFPFRSLMNGTSKRMVWVGTLFYLAFFRIVILMWRWMFAVILLYRFQVLRTIVINRLRLIDMVSERMSLRRYLRRFGLMKNKYLVLKKNQPLPELSMARQKAMQRIADMTLSAGKKGYVPLAAKLLAMASAVLDRIENVVSSLYKGAETPAEDSDLVTLERRKFSAALSSELTTSALERKLRNLEKCINKLTAFDGD